MPYKLLGDAVVVFHLLWIFFLIFGGFWGRRYHAVRVVHVAALCFAVLVEVFDWYCPLTYVEVWFRGRENPAVAYGGSFIAHYLERVIYPEVDRGLLVLLTLLLFVFNLWIYFGRRRSR